MISTGWVVREGCRRICSSAFHSSSRNMGVPASPKASGVLPANIRTWTWPPRRLYRNRKMMGRSSVIEGDSGDSGDGLLHVIEVARVGEKDSVRLPTVKTKQISCHFICLDTYDIPF